MANTILHSLLNPLKFVPIDPDRPDAFVSRHMDDYLFQNTIRDSEQPVRYAQPFLAIDPIRDQIKSNYGTISLRLYSCDGTFIQTYNYDTKQQDIDQPDYYIRQIDISISSLQPGVYYFIRRAAGVDLHISEPFEVLEDGTGTLAIDYWHYEKRGGIYFQVPYGPRIRIYGAMVYNDTLSNDIDYEDQNLNEELLKATPYRVWDFFANGNNGMPPYLVDKIKRIIGCSELQIDGRDYVKPEDNKWERVAEPLYPMYGHRTRLRERYNQDEQRTESDQVITGVAAASLIVSTKGFGMSDGSQGYEQIEQLK